jgi:hypothetical protein
MRLVREGVGRGKPATSSVEGTSRQGVADQARVSIRAESSEPRTGLRYTRIDINQFAILRHPPGCRHNSNGAGMLALHPAHYVDADDPQLGHGLHRAFTEEQWEHIPIQLESLDLLIRLPSLMHSTEKHTIPEVHRERLSP